ncbi:energy transducer TonB [Flavobacterium sp. WC2430]|uniref:energy transducer TonB n=1 Tax=Flavobacterium sp. WC2430 TaxID=3234137 RepID=UPI003465EC80
MKKNIILFVLFMSLASYGQKKVYYTEDFKEQASAKDATYYSTFQESKDGTQRTTYYLDATIRNSDQFSNLRKHILNGESVNWYKNGNKESILLYTKGKQEGIQTRYYENGQIKRTENYKNDEFIDGKCFDQNGLEIAFFPYYVKPEFPGGMQEFYRYIGKNFKSKNNAKGLIKVDFVVEIDGSLRDFKIKEGLNYDMNLEALRVLFNSPLWIPGKVEGKDSRVKYSIPITIK